MMEKLGFSFMFLGLALVFLGTILLIAGKNKSKVEAGGAVFIGPFPVFLGATSKTALIAVILLSFLVFFILSILSVTRT